VIFVDTSFWLGLFLPRDTHHLAARTLLPTHASDPLVTSNHVRGETWTFVRRRGGHRDAVRVLDALEATPRLSVVFIAEDVEREAVRWLRDRDEREYSFVDATSFALMRKLRIRDAFAFDGDFAAAGFLELRP